MASSRRLLAVASFALLLGCRDVPGRGGAGGHDPAARDPGRTSRWTAPVIYHGVPFQFELAEGEEGRLLLPGAETDLIGILGPNERSVEWRYNSFHIAGRRLERTNGARVLVHLPLRPPQPWRREFGGLELIWYGDTHGIPVEQETADRMLWILGPARVEISRGGAVRLTGPDGEERLRAPCTLVLAADGRRTSARP